jgi:hypothetical protein
MDFISFIVALIIIALAFGSILPIVTIDIYLEGKKSWQERVKKHKFLCPYCLKYHKVDSVADNGEDLFLVFLRCPEVQLVKITYEFRDSN